MSEVNMPRLSDSMEEGTIIAWSKDDGDTVAVGEEIVEIETDKANMSYAAQEAGTIQIVAPVGATIAVGEPIARIGDQVAVLASAAQSTGASKGHAGNGSGMLHAARVKASPLARRMATDLGIALETLVGSGPNGRIVKADIDTRTAETQPEPPVPTPAPVSAPVPAASPVPVPVAAAPRPAAVSIAAPTVAAAPGTASQLTRLQQTIARRMVRSRMEIPDFTVSVDVDAAPISELRVQLREAVGEGRSAPSLNDMVIKAAALALREHPRANASYSDDGVTLHDHVNIGFAVAGQDALLVPILADADLKSLGRITRESRALAERARGGQITAAELDGGTFTISNLGMYGALECIPVINGSQAAILGVGAVRTEPVVTDGELAVGQRVRLTVACDHRILYGADAAQFLDAVRSVLEHPLSLAL